MAAPETRGLRATRVAILGVCGALVAWTAMIDPLRAALGDIVGIVAGALLILLALLVPGYVRAKIRADDAHLDQRIAAGEFGGGGPAR